MKHEEQIAIELNSVKEKCMEINCKAMTSLEFLACETVDHESIHQCLPSGQKKE